MPGSITTDDLARRIEDAEKLPYILDLRAGDQFERWRIEGKLALDTVNIPYWTALGDIEGIAATLPEDQDVIAICAHGGSSGMVVEMMERANVMNLEGGMDLWANTLIPRTLFDDGTHFVVQLDRMAKACLSYAVGARGHTMAVIDPAADAERYLALADQYDATITDLFDTHLHADHISIGVAMAEQTGATYRISPGDAEEAVFEYTPLEDGQVFTFGEMEMIVRSVATPGHTPGSTSLEVHGRYLMTGDAVFVTGVGRPDLGGETEPWARDLFNTIHVKLSPLDPALEVCPAHYTSRTESLEDGTLRRSLGDLVKNDPVVSIADEAEFVDFVVSHLGEPPAIYADIRKVNLGVLMPDAEKAKELEVGRNECALSK
ncbi:MAG: MBL fold metallo-hydrolase [Acidimicrobiia bacterium]|nr:MBL fold metallo-hydrolase [Acidimicrobiia bacterium]